MSKLKLLVLCVLIATLMGCGKKIDAGFLPVDGSKADGKIVMKSIVFTQYDTVTFNENIMDKSALERCKSWGYTDIEGYAVQQAFAGILPSAWGPVTTYQMVKNYQCRD